MWTPLNYGQDVCVGDKIRYNNQALTDHQKVYEVEKTDQYYFVIAPEGGTEAAYLRSQQKKVVRHFDVEYYLALERWTD
jgi:hypothetical protein